MSKECGTAQVRNTLWVERLTMLAVRVAQYSAVAQKWIRDSKESLAGRLDLARARLNNRASTLAQNNIMIIGSHDHNREGAKRMPITVERIRGWTIRSFGKYQPWARIESNMVARSVGYNPLEISRENLSENQPRK